MAGGRIEGIRTAFHQRSSLPGFDVEADDAGVVEGLSLRSAHCKQHGLASGEGARIFVHSLAISEVYFGDFLSLPAGSRNPHHPTGHRADKIDRVIVCPGSARKRSEGAQSRGRLHCGSAGQGA